MLDGCPSRTPIVDRGDHGRGGDDGDEEEETDEAQCEKNGFTSGAIEEQNEEDRISREVRGEEKERSEEEGGCQENRRKKEVGRQAEQYAASGESRQV